MFGDDIKDLNVLIRQYKNSNYKATSLWSKTGGQNDAWNRAEVTLTSTAPFQVKFPSLVFFFLSALASSCLYIWGEGSNYGLFLAHDWDSNPHSIDLAISTSVVKSIEFIFWLLSHRSVGSNSGHDTGVLEQD